MDEPGFSAVQYPSLMLAPQGQKRRGSDWLGKEQEHNSYICAMGVSGNFVPPFFIFSLQRNSIQLTKDGPCDAEYEYTPNGWTNNSMSVKWLKHFSKFVKWDLNHPGLLILKNHSSHATQEGFEFCTENGIVMSSICPHTSRRLQPLGHIRWFCKESLSGV
jgi:hypothetical protein